MPNFGCVKFLANGTVDNSFGTNGSTIVQFNTDEDMAMSMAIDATGKILMGGYYTYNSQTDFALVRLNSTGLVENTFGTNGMVKTAISNDDDAIASINLQADGKLIAVGYTTSTTSGLDFCLARYTFTYPTSINEEILSKVSIQIYPNPISSILNIKSQYPISKIEVVN